MKPEVGRRVFVGTVVAGLPLIAGKTGLLAQGPTALHDHANLFATVDPVIDQIVRQMAAIHNAAQSGPRGEHFRALAMQLRMLAVYQRQLGVDGQMRTAIRDLVDREGRNAVLYTEPDQEMRANAMRHYGFRLDERGRDIVPPPTYVQREAALDRLISEGITPAFERLAAAAERISRELDRRPIGLITIARQDSDYQEGYCDSIWESYQEAQTLAMPVCMAAKLFEWVMPACVALEGGAATLLLAWIIRCMMSLGN